MPCQAAAVQAAKTQCAACCWLDKPQVHNVHALTTTSLPLRCALKAKRQAKVEGHMAQNCLEHQSPCCPYSRQAKQQVKVEGRQQVAQNCLEHTPFSALFPTGQAASQGGGTRCTLHVRCRRPGGPHAQVRRLVSTFSLCCTGCVVRHAPCCRCMGLEFWVWSVGQAMIQAQSHHQTEHMVTQPLPPRWSAASWPRAGTAGSPSTSSTATRCR